MPRRGLDWSRWLWILLTTVTGALWLASQDPFLVIRGSQQQPGWLTPDWYMLTAFPVLGMLVADVYVAWFRRGRYGSAILLATQIAMMTVLSHLRLTLRLPLSGHALLLSFYLLHWWQSRTERLSQRLELALAVLMAALITWMKLVEWQDPLSWSVGIALGAAVFLAGSGLSRIAKLAVFLVLLLPMGAAELSGKEPACETLQIRENLRTGRGDCSTRPTSVGFLQSSLFPFRVHYESAGLQAEAMLVLAEVEESWQREVVEMGFFAPTADAGGAGSDDFDVYLTEPAGGFLGYFCPEDEDFSTSWIDLYGHMAVESGLETGLRQATVAHEFNHACQSAMDYNESDALWESTATWVEDQVYDSVNDYALTLEPFQSRPDLRLSLVNYITRFHYGSCLFPFFLSERFDSGGGGIIAELWDRSRQDADLLEPDYFDTAELIIQERSLGTLTLETAFLEFGAWRYFTGSRDDGQHFSEAGQWPESSLVALDSVHSTVNLPLEDLSPSRALQPFGTSYLQLQGPGIPDLLTLEVQPASGTARFALAAIVESGARGNGFEWSEPGVGLRQLSLSGVSGAGKVTFLVAHFGDGSFDPDQSVVPAVSFSYSLGASASPTATPSISPTASPTAISPSVTPTQGQPSPTETPALPTATETAKQGTTATPTPTGTGLVVTSKHSHWALFGLLLLFLPVTLPKMQRPRALLVTGEKLGMEGPSSLNGVRDVRGPESKKEAGLTQRREERQKRVVEAQSA